MSKINDNKLVPKLRFPEFTNEAEWEEKSLEEIANVVASGDLDEKNFSPIKTDTHIYPVYSNSISLEGIYGYSSTSKYKNSSITITARGTLGVAFERKTDFVGIGRLLVVSELKDVHSNFLKEAWNHQAKIPLENGGIPQLTAVKAKSITLFFPKYKEQQKIASCLSSLDEVITAESQKLEVLKDYKKGLLQNLFPQEGQTMPNLRFPEFNDVWTPDQLSNLLDYERPDNYIVNDTNYTTTGTPVLTANKSFILGYTEEKIGICKDIPAIIFDDFTVDNKYVDFPFKVKSSAIKILRPKGKVDLKFIFELMSQIRFEAKEHKRYYISAYQNLTVLIPKPKEQQKIASFLSSIDDLINTQSQKVETLKFHKKGLLQGLFPNINEVTE